MQTVVNVTITYAFHLAGRFPFQDSRPCDTWRHIIRLPVNNRFSQNDYRFCLQNSFNTTNPCFVLVLTLNGLASHPSWICLHIEPWYWHITMLVCFAGMPCCLNIFIVSFNTQMLSSKSIKFTCTVKNSTQSTAEYWFSIIIRPVLPDICLLILFYRAAWNAVAV